MILYAPQLLYIKGRIKWSTVKQSSIRGCVRGNEFALSTRRTESVFFIVKN